MAKKKDDIKFPTEGWIYSEHIRKTGNLKGSKDRSWKKLVEGRMIVFHSRRKAMEFIDAYGRFQDERKAIESVCGYERRFRNMKRKTKVEADETAEEKKKRLDKRKKVKLDHEVREDIAKMEQQIKSLAPDTRVAGQVCVP